MIAPEAKAGGVHNSSSSASGSGSASVSAGGRASSEDQASSFFDSEDFDKDQQMLDDSLSKFQLKRQNRISIKKKKGNGF